MNIHELRRIDAAELRRLVPMADAIDLLDAALRAGLDPEVDVPRVITELPPGQLLMMPSGTGTAGQRYAGVKLSTIVPENPERGLPRVQGVYLVLEGSTLAPLALVDGAELTLLRTPAVSGVAIRHLAAPGPSRLTVFGTGPQAWGHVRAVAAVREIRQVDIIGRTPAHVDDFVRRCREAGFPAAPAGPEAVADADIVTCCTSAREAVFDGHVLPRDAVVLAIGSHEPSAREVDEETVRRSTLVVEARSAALREAGDIVLPVHSRAITTEHIAGNLADLVHGRIPLGARPRLFKGVGMAWQDLVVAGAAVDRLATNAFD